MGRQLRRTALNGVRSGLVGSDVVARPVAAVVANSTRLDPWMLRPAPDLAA
jgi:hypothetical protein